ncbi:VOC family protein [Nocardioides aequoreus]|uniref:VOC family protein n=1 Tax=Nocardioides aequoreus TaxID=397278 RepID=UPI0006909213|nr:VOC family protein [Nocardioides aequoreus]
MSMRPTTPITPTLWVNGHDLRQVADYYLEVFDGKVTGDSPFTVQVTLDGVPFTLLQGGETRFEPNESVSFALSLPDQESVDRVWDHFAKEGVPSACGWIKDRYGFSWQVVPTRLYEMLTGDDAEATARVTECFLQVHGRAFDIAELEAAYAGR